MWKVGLAVIATAVTSFAISAGTGLGQTRAGTATLRIGQHVRAPQIDWTCDYGIVQGQVSLSCSPGETGSKTQGDPILAVTYRRVTSVGVKATVQALPTPTGPLYIYSFGAKHR